MGFGMPDIIDDANDYINIIVERNILAIRSAAAAEMPEGVAGICERCEEDSGSLILGHCARCREKHNLR